MVQKHDTSGNGHYQKYRNLPFSGKDADQFFGFAAFQDEALAMNNLGDKVVAMIGVEEECPISHQ
jgi:hypothetical protein